ncbi:MAG: type II toxin-antitoxin system RelE/ParE family toxin [Planctomycetaceae bacterium]|nr:type II toxin-antitoxin system RelE/ParE family toxin [Planctomycetaceae bacterium]
MSPSADQDIISILAWTEKEFGEAVRLRYELLIAHSILDVAENPDRPGCHRIPEIGPEVGIYHLKNSRDRISRSTDRIQTPRHFLIFRVLPSGDIEISRVLHDRMELKRHLPDSPG